MQSAKESYILCDKTKIETDRYFPFLPTKNVTNLITNDSLDEDLKIQYKENGVNVL
jgi:DeoR/GlpR family transcriptional regulator of sugar metabolism